MIMFVSFMRRQRAYGMDKNRYRYVLHLHGQAEDRKQRKIWPASQYHFRFHARTMFKVQVITVLMVCGFTRALPFDSSSLLSDIDADNYDIIIDQRQNGSLNLKIKVHDVSIAIPEDSSEPSGGESPEQLLALFGSAAGSTFDLDSLSDLFNLEKKSSDKKNSETQSRTKDIPTVAQINESPKLAIKQRVKEEQRRYKLLVGEKYIVPIIRFLKKAAELDQE
jgi:hypothetical protein